MIFAGFVGPAWSRATEIPLGREWLGGFGRIGGKRSPLDSRKLARAAQCRARLGFRCSRFLMSRGHWVAAWLPSVVVGELNTDLTSVPSSIHQLMPDIGLATARNYDLCEINVVLSNQFRFPIVVENGYLQLVVVGGVMHRKAEFLIPTDGQSR
jgi:hypothetical protein